MKATFKVYFKDDSGYNERLYEANSLYDVVKHMHDNYPELDVYCIEKVF